MNDLTKKDIEDVVNKSSDEVMEVLQTLISRIDSRFDEVESRIGKLEDNLNKLMISVDRLIGRIDTYETELAARDHKIMRLERYIEVIAKKTGIDLNSIKF